MLKLTHSKIKRTYKSPVFPYLICNSQLKRIHQSIKFTYKFSFSYNLCVKLKQNTYSRERWQHIKLINFLRLYVKHFLKNSGSVFCKNSLFNLPNIRRMDKNFPWYCFFYLKLINPCGESEKFQERLSSHKATASQPILDMSWYYLCGWTWVDWKGFVGMLIHFVSASAVFRGS